MLVQKLRLQRGWSQQQLAELSGLNVRTIQRIEKGQEPSVESLKSLAVGAPLAPGWRIFSLLPAAMRSRLALIFA